jgi:hypothetical protein
MRVEVKILAVNKPKPGPKSGKKKSPEGKRRLFPRANAEKEKTEADDSSGPKSKSQEVIVTIRINEKTIKAKLKQYQPDPEDQHIIGTQNFYKYFNNLYHLYDFNIFAITSGETFSAGDLIPTPDPRTLLAKVKPPTVDPNIEYIIGARGVYQNFCLRANPKSHTYYNLFSPTDFQLKCFINTAAKPTDAPENCRNYSSPKTCLACQRGFFNSWVKTPVPLQPSEQFLDEDLKSK